MMLVTLHSFAALILLPFINAFLIGDRNRPSCVVRSSSIALPTSREKYHYFNYAARTRLYSGWGPEPIWETCTVISSRPASKFCVEVSVQVSSEKAKQYRTPGQYVQMRDTENQAKKPVFLAIASPPASGLDSSTFEFLIKRTDSNDWICNAASGSNLDVSQILGNGFPIQENLEGFKYDFPTQNVILCATGSGIAPIRAAIESRQLNIAVPPKGGRTARLYYGARTPEEMSYAEKFSEWEALGFEIVPIISQPEGTDWIGRTGYVQTALEEDGVPIPRNSGALLCGVKGMVDSVKSLLTSGGVFEGRVLTNY